MTFFPEGQPVKVLLEWFKKQKKEEFTIHDVLDADIEIRDIRAVLWQLIDNNDLEFVNGLKIRVKGGIGRCG